MLVDLWSTFYSACTARIASAVLATAIPSVRPSVCPSVTEFVYDVVVKELYVRYLISWWASCLLFWTYKDEMRWERLPLIDRLLAGLAFFRQTRLMMRRRRLDDVNWRLAGRLQTAFVCCFQPSVSQRNLKGPSTLRAVRRHSFQWVQLQRTLAYQSVLDPARPDPWCIWSCLHDLTRSHNGDAVIVQGTRQIMRTVSNQMMSLSRI